MRRKSPPDSPTGLSIWLPDPIIKRTPKILVVNMPIYFKFNSDKKLQIIEGLPPAGIRSGKRVTKRLLKEHRPVICKPNPIKTALLYQRIYNDKSYKTMAKVAQEFGVSRVRIHQILNLLKLDQRIIDYIANITDPRQSNYWTERRLRGIASLPMERQFSKFQTLFQDSILRP